MGISNYKEVRTCREAFTLRAADPAVGAAWQAARREVWASQEACRHRLVTTYELDLVQAVIEAALPDDVLAMVAAAEAGTQVRVCNYCSAVFMVGNKRVRKMREALDVDVEEAGGDAAVLPPAVVVEGMVVGGPVAPAPEVLGGAELPDDDEERLVWSEEEEDDVVRGGMTVPSGLSLVGFTKGPKFRRPELLQHPPLPQGLWGLNPRTLLGQAWWDRVRARAAKQNNACCWACGAPAGCDPDHPRHEGHEAYEIDWQRRRARLAEVTSLCWWCHRFIHPGQTQQQVQQGEIGLEVYQALILRGHGLLSSVGLTPHILSRYDMGGSGGEETEDRRTFFNHVGYDPTSKAIWGLELRRFVYFQDKRRERLETEEGAVEGEGVGA